MRKLHNLGPSPLTRRQGKTAGHTHSTRGHICGEQQLHTAARTNHFLTTFVQPSLRRPEPMASKQVRYGTFPGHDKSHFSCSCQCCHQHQKMNGTQQTRMCDLHTLLWKPLLFLHNNHDNASRSTVVKRVSHATCCHTPRQKRPICTRGFFPGICALRNWPFHRVMTHVCTALKLRTRAGRSRIRRWRRWEGGLLEVKTSQTTHSH